MAKQQLFKWRHFQADIILVCVRCICAMHERFRDLEELMLERGLSIDHTTIYRWVQHFAPVPRKLYAGKEM